MLQVLHDNSELFRPHKRKGSPADLGISLAGGWYPELREGESSSITGSGIIVGSGCGYARRNLDALKRRWVESKSSLGGLV